MPDQTSRTLGIVSNCWKAQLECGQLLISLVQQAQEFGLRAVELRQGSLGEYEDAGADAHQSATSRDRLAELSCRFPAIQFNLAVSLPLFGEPVEINDQRVQSAVAAAIALAHDGQPHLRIVDTQTRSASLGDAAIEQATHSFGTLTKLLAAAGGTLSIEHAYQSWPVFWSTILRVRRQLGPAQLRICFDPCNLLLTEPPETIPEIVHAVEPSDVSMIHIKQRCGGQIQPDVALGDLDWRRLLATMDGTGHRGPWLFEVAPHADLWDNLKRSISFVFPKEVV